ncbi:unnamed protein product, partial [Mesorhabditis spiculigera]
MTCFPPDELVAYIRHELHGEDETGLCDRLFPKPIRRAKYGGLRAGFRMDTEEEDDDPDDYLEEVPAQEPAGTSEMIANRLKARTGDLEKAGQVDVLPTAKVWEVIGLCCLIYHRATGIVLSGEPSDYELYITDDGEVETDFPPLETARRIGDMGFSTLALISRQRNEKRYLVHVYFTTGETYSFELEHLGQTVGWLRDQAVQRMLEDMDEEDRQRAEILPEWNVESANGFDSRLNPEQTIESTHAIDFVVYRKNKFPSSYGGSGGSAPPTPSPRPSLPPSFALFEWELERIHKYQPKHPVVFKIRYDGIEMGGKVEERRRSIMGPGPRAKFYVNQPWKAFQLQCETLEIAEEIAARVDGEIREREPPAYKAWQRSADGSRKPANAAELALIEEDGPMATPTTSSSRSIKRPSRLAGTIRRMLSVQKD